jgi:hypothetical protein
MRVRRLRRSAGGVVAKDPDLLTLALSSTQTWRRGEQRALEPVFHAALPEQSESPLLDVRGAEGNRRLWSPVCSRG